MLPQVLKPYDELWYCLGHFLSHRVKLVHEIPLGDASMEQLDELFLELVEVLRVSTRCLTIQRKAELGYLGDTRGCVPPRRLCRCNEDKGKASCLPRNC